MHILGLFEPLGIQASTRPVNQARTYHTTQEASQAFGGGGGGREIKKVEHNPGVSWGGEAEPPLFEKIGCWGLGVEPIMIAIILI